MRAYVTVRRNREMEYIIVISYTLVSHHTKVQLYEGQPKSAKMHGLLTRFQIASLFNIQYSRDSTMTYDLCRMFAFVNQNKGAWQPGSVTSIVDHVTNSVKGKNGKHH